MLLGLLLRTEEQRIRGEQRLASSEARYRTLFESAGDALLLLDGERFVECNQRALELFGATREALVGATPFAFFTPRFSPMTGPPTRLRGNTFRTR